MSTEKLFSVMDVADKLGVSDARVRQLCIEYEIGQIVGSSRVLTEEDVEQLEEIRSNQRKYEKRA